MSIAVAASDASAAAAGDAQGAVVCGAALQVLGAFRLRVDSMPIALPVHSQRVLAFLAVRGRSQRRQSVAEGLWPDVSQERCYASLRTALWRIGQASSRLVHASRDLLTLHDDVSVDVDGTWEQAHRLLSLDAVLSSADAGTSLLEGDLLPDWDEDWVLVERERLRQLRLHALEALSRHLLREGRYSHAIQAAYAAVATEPLRESAYSALIDVHLAEGNLGEAHRELDRLTTVLWTELHARPSEALCRRVART